MKGKNQMRTTKEQLLLQIKNLLGEQSSSDEAIKLYEDISDSFNDDTLNELENYKKQISVLEEKVQSVESSWREKYTSRFFEPTKTEPVDDTKPEEHENDYESVTVEDLFND